jgi:hypothetical protein
MDEAIAATPGAGKSGRHTSFSPAGMFYPNVLDWRIRLGQGTSGAKACAVAPDGARVAFAR